MLGHDQSHTEDSIESDERRPDLQGLDDEYPDDSLVLKDLTELFVHNFLDRHQLGDSTIASTRRGLLANPFKCAARIRAQAILELTYVPEPSVSEEREHAFVEFLNLVNTDLRVGCLVRSSEYDFIWEERSGLSCAFIIGLVYLNCGRPGKRLLGNMLHTVFDAAKRLPLALNAINSGTSPAKAIEMTPESVSLYRNPSLQGRKRLRDTLIQWFGETSFDYRQVVDEYTFDVMGESHEGDASRFVAQATQQNQVIAEIHMPGLVSPDGLHAAASFAAIANQELVLARGNLYVDPANGKVGYRMGIDACGCEAQVNTTMINYLVKPALGTAETLFSGIRQAVKGVSPREAFDMAPAVPDASCVQGEASPGATGDVSTPISGRPLAEAAFPEGPDSLTSDGFADTAHVEEHEPEAEADVEEDLEREAKHFAPMGETTTPQPAEHSAKTGTFDAGQPERREHEMEAQRDSPEEAEALAPVVVPHTAESVILTQSETVTGEGLADGAVPGRPESEMEAQRELSQTGKPQQKALQDSQKDVDSVVQQPVAKRHEAESPLDAWPSIPDRAEDQSRQASLRDLQSHAVPTEMGEPYGETSSGEISYALNDVDGVARRLEPDVGARTWYPPDRERKSRLLYGALIAAAGFACVVTFALGLALVLLIFGGG